MSPTLRRSGWWVVGDSDLAVKPATSPGEDMATVLAAAGSMAVEANTAAASFLRTLEENGTAQTIRDASIAALAIGKRIEEEFERSGGKDFLLKAVVVADAVTREVGHWLHESGAAEALYKMAEAERALNERVLGKDLLLRIRFARWIDSTGC